MVQTSSEQHWNLRKEKLSILDQKRLQKFLFILNGNLPPRHLSQ